MVEVTQADREAAARAGIDMSRLNEVDADALRQGGAWDEWALVQAFAHHRKAAVAEKDAEIVRLRKALISVRDWAASLNGCDMNEIVADGGITAGMVVGQEAGEQVRRIDRSLAGDRND